MSGTVGTAAWNDLPHFDEISGGRCGQDEGSSGDCNHDVEAPHLSGEWIGAVILVEHHLIAEYALTHYLEQPRVLDAFIDGRED